jgi:hypothetical protein
MEKITHKVHEPYTWDINGEDYYWIINEAILEPGRNELEIKKDLSCNTTANGG